jgi:hypothetical protein
MWLLIFEVWLMATTSWIEGAVSHRPVNEKCKREKVTWLFVKGNPTQDDQ